MTSSAVASSVSGDRKSTRLNSSHLGMSYAVFCLKKKSAAGAHSELRTVLGYAHAKLTEIACAHIPLTIAMIGTDGMITDAATRGDFFFNDTATTEIYTLSLHDALPI